jgi:hypothetical protein
MMVAETSAKFALREFPSRSKPQLRLAHREGNSKSNGSRSLTLILGSTRIFCRELVALHAQRSVRETARTAHTYRKSA